MPSSTSTNVTLRIDDEELERIDWAAAEHGETRTEYLLRWVPEHYGLSTTDQNRPSKP